MQFGLRTLMFVVLLLAILVLSVPLLFKPLQEQRDAAIQETHQKQAKLDALAGAMARTKNIAEEIKNLQKAIAFLEGKLPGETEMDKVLQDVWNAAKESKLTVKSVRNAKP